LLRFIWTLIFYGSICYGLYYVYDTYFVKVIAERPEQQIFSQPHMQVQSVHLEAYTDAGLKEFELFGPKAVFVEKEKEVQIENPTLRLFDETGKAEMILLAKKGRRIEADVQYVELSGKVEGTRINGSKIFSNKLIYYPGIQRLVSPGPFKYVDVEQIVEGDSFWYLLREQRGEIKGDVKTRLHEDVEVVNAEMYLGLDNEKQK
jgi:LPS export ABC transporter protein LptC